MDNYPSFDQVIKARTFLRDSIFSYWLHSTFLTWRWWLLLVLAIVPWAIWWRIVDKKRIQEIFLYGFAIIIITILLDTIGTTSIWWGYPNELICQVPLLGTPDITLVPIYLMIVYQYFNKNFKTFLIANLIGGAVVAFIIEWIFIFLQYYVMYTWKSIYSWLFYIFVSIISRWIVMKIIKKQDSSPT